MSKKPHEFVVQKSLTIATHPGRSLLSPLQKRFARHFAPHYRFARLAFTLDLFLLGSAVTLIAGMLFFTFWKPFDPTQGVQFEALAAPEEIVSGSPTSLVIRITNTSESPLEDSDLSLSFPEHFLLQELEAGDANIPLSRIPFGDIAPESTRTITIRGVMFGNVGEPQVFRSLLTFRYGKKREFFEAHANHLVTPSRSALALRLELPEKLTAFQDVTGRISYSNESVVALPEIVVEPRWPEGFVLTGSSVALRQGAFRIPGVEPGESGVINFEGRLGISGDAIPFIFEPSFTFGDTRYAQDILTQETIIATPTVTVSHTIEEESATPGGTLHAHVRIENTGETSVEDVSLGLQSSSPFAGTPPTISLPELRAHGVHEFDLELPVKRSINASQTEVVENLSVDTYAMVQYRTTDAPAQRITLQSPSITIPLTSPVNLRAFGRYSSEQGDQLGRGELPPLVGEATTYWVFWHVSGTTNELTDVTLTARLPAHTRFTGRQSVSQGGSVRADAGTITWSLPRIPPTFGSGRIFGAAFEIELIPGPENVGTSPPLLSGTTLTGRDNRTGALVSASAPGVTTSLPHDAWARDYPLVEE